MPQYTTLIALRALALGKGDTGQAVSGTNTRSYATSRGLNLRSSDPWLDKHWARSLVTPATPLARATPCPVLTAAHAGLSVVGGGEGGLHVAVDVSGLGGSVSGTEVAQVPIPTLRKQCKRPHSACTRARAGGCLCWISERISEAPCGAAATPHPELTARIVLLDSVGGAGRAGGLPTRCLVLASGLHSPCDVRH
eukprot:1254831-Rhodomonas_salina.2